MTEIDRETCKHCDRPVKWTLEDDVCRKCANKYSSDERSANVDHVVNDSKNCSHSDDVSRSETTSRGESTDSHSDDESRTVNLETGRIVEDTDIVTIDASGDNTDEQCPDCGCEQFLSLIGGRRICPKCGGMYHKSEVIDDD